MSLGNRLLIVVIVSVGFTLTSHNGYSDERYFLNDQRVLLYKIINWWYDANPAEAGQICGDRLRYENNRGWNLHESDNEIRLTHAGGQSCGSLVSLRSHCAHSSTTTFRVQPEWANTEYFEVSDISFEFEEQTTSNRCTIIIDNVSQHLLERMRTGFTELKLTINGRVNGLGNGKVALLSGGDCYQRCPIWSAAERQLETVRIDLVNSSSGESLARFMLP